MFFFWNIVKELNLSLGQELLTKKESYQGFSFKIYREIKNTLVWLLYSKTIAVSVKHVSVDEITKETKNLVVKKASQDKDIASKVIKNNSDRFVDFFC